MTNISNLPQNLQQKLQPYVNVAKDVDSAIAMAKANGTWTAADDKAFNAFNGDANWGKVMDEFAFDSSKKAEYKQDAQLARANVKTKTVETPSNTARRAALRQSIVENKNKGGISGYLNAFADAVKYNMTPAKDGIQQASGPWMALGAAVLAVATVATMTSCNPDDDIEYNFIGGSDDPINPVTRPKAKEVIEMLMKVMAQINTLSQSDNVDSAELERLQKVYNSEIAGIKDFLCLARYKFESSDEYAKKIVMDLDNDTECIKFINEILIDGDKDLQAVKEQVEAEYGNESDDASIAIMVLKALVQAKFYSNEEE